MEAIKNGLCKNLTPAQLWSGARFFLLLNLSLIICAAALNFYCAPNHFEGVIQRFTSRRGRRRPHLHPSPCSSGMQAMHRGSYLRPQHNSPLMRHLTRMALLC